MKNLIFVLCMAFVTCFGLDCRAQECTDDDNFGLTSSEQSILEAFGSAVDMIANWFDLETLKNTVESVYTSVTSAFNGLTNSFTQLLEDWGILDGLISALESTISAVEDAVAFVQGLIDTVGGWMDDVLNGVGGALNDAGEWVSDAAGDAGDFFEDVGGGIGGLFGGMILAGNGEPFPIEASVNNEDVSDFNNDEPTTAFLPPNGVSTIGTPPQPNQSQESYTIANFSEADIYHNPIIIHPIFNGQFPEWSLVDFNAYNIDNTPDILKPVSSAQQEELSQFPMWASAPLYSNDAGSEGAIAFDESYFYAYNNGAWNRVTLASW
ncbi:MAG: hypothetical protein CMD33_02670 [Flavobacteriales bacterium]|nr:hypothetical protein [Flavobacteriales bacterium]